MTTSNMATQRHFLVVLLQTSRQWEKMTTNISCHCFAMGYKRDTTTTSNTTTHHHSVMNCRRKKMTTSNTTACHHFAMGCRCEKMTLNSVVVDHRSNLFLQV
jgi:hypothetical protein